MFRRLTTILLFAASLLIGSSAMAGGLYLGAGIGNTFFSSEYQDALDQVKEIDENSTAYKFFGGFNSESFFSVEGGYRNFGKVDSNDGNDQVTSKTQGWDVEAMGRVTLSIVDLFGKAGVMFWTNDSSIGSITADSDGTDFLWGLGAGVHLGTIGVRLEWESLEVDGPDNLSMVSLSATLGF